MSFLEKFSLNGKNALIIGGASGIGEAIAMAYVDAGANVIIADVNENLAEKVANKIRQTGKESEAIKVDVTKQDEIEKMVDVIIKKYKKIDIFVNSAGINKKIPAEEFSLEDWYQVMDINLNGVFVACQKIGKEMIKQKSGSIINVSSMSGFIVNKERTISAYCVSKSGVNMLTKTLASEWAKHNIRVNAIAPGYVETPFTANWVADKNMNEEACNLIPMKRIATPDEIACSAVFLGSSASSYITGHVLLVDGGYTIW